jgi:hypothetical protein
MKKTPEELKAALPSMSIASIATEVKADWQKVYFGAVPYLDAMRSMNKITDQFGLDSGESIVIYFLGNAQTWRGPIAREVKAELHRRVKSAR